MGLFGRLFNNLRDAIVRAFGGDPRYTQHFDWDPTQGGGGGSYTAGDGIDISSNRISAKVDNSTIKVNGSGQLYSTAGGDVTKEYVDTQDQALQDQIDDKQDEITDTIASAGLTDSDYMSDLSGTGNKRFIVTKIWDYIKGKITGAVSTALEQNFITNRAIVTNASGKFIESQTSAVELSYVKDVTGPIQDQLDDKADKSTTYTKSEVDTELAKKLTATGADRGLDITSNKVGHSNSITVPTAKRILQATYDAQGHVTAIETEFNWSNTYTTSADNQLFTRKGANNMYTELKPTYENLTITLSNTSEIKVQSNASKLYKIGKLGIIDVDIRFETTASKSASTGYFTIGATFSGTVREQLNKASGAGWSHIPLSSINESGSYPVDGVDFYNIGGTNANIRISARNGWGTGNAIRVQGTLVYLSS